MIIRNPLRDIAKYKNVYVIKADGTKLFATREEQDELLPARWDCEESHTDYSNVAIFKPLVMEITEPLTTEALIRKAQDEGYGDWQTEEEEVL